MNIYLPLLVIALITAAVSAGLYLAEKRTAFGSWNPGARQVLYGVIFGILAICGTEFGANAGGITLNESTAAPLCAGLIFGAPAGVISGLIGGVERLLCHVLGSRVLRPLRGKHRHPVCRPFRRGYAPFYV